MPYIVIGSFLPMTAIGAIAFTVDFVTNATSDTPLGGLLVLWLLALVNGGLLAGIYLFRRARRTKWLGLAREVTARLQGRVITTAPEWVAWLNALWAGPYDITRLLPGPCWHVITGRVGAFAVAVDLEPVPADAESSRPRAEVLLAACLAPDAPAPAPPQDLASPARALGFQLSACSGGFAASMGR
jgi:hypothetical protein